jgi:hypothetical protein
MMAILKQRTSALKHLQEQVSALKRKEKATQEKLRLALVNVRQIVKDHEKVQDTQVEAAVF